MNIILSKEIIKRSRLRNGFLRSNSEADKKNYVKRTNYCVSLLRRTKKENFGNLDPKNVADNRTFCRTVKPFPSNKYIENEKIILVEKEEVLTHDSSVAKVLNNFFSSIVKTLGVSDYMHSHPLTKKVNNPTLRAIRKYQNHPSVLTILDKYKNNSIFTFSHVTKKEVLKEIGNLDTTKSSQDTDISTKIITQNSFIFASFTYKSFNNMIDSLAIPAVLKLAHITLVFKKDSKNSKENYGPVSILPNISKSHERCIYKQMSGYLGNFFSKFQCGFPQSITAKHCLRAMIEKWKQCVDKGKTFGALITDLSKAFDYFPHDLIIEKLNTHGFGLSASELIYNYL